MTKSPGIFLQHILESIELIEKRTKNIKFEEFERDIDLQDMIIRRLEIIGEAVKNLPKEFLKNYSHVNWQNPADMRNVLIHAYFDVDLRVVWDTIVNDLPPFKQQIQKLLQDFNLSEGNQ